MELNYKDRFSWLITSTVEVSILPVYQATKVELVSLRSTDPKKRLHWSNQISHWHKETGNPYILGTTQTSIEILNSSAYWKPYRKTIITPLSSDKRSRPTSKKSVETFIIRLDLQNAALMSCCVQCIASRSMESKNLRIADAVRSALP